MPSSILASSQLSFPNFGPLQTEEQVLAALDAHVHSAEASHPIVESAHAESSSSLSDNLRRTDNGALAYKSTLDPILDLFTSISEAAASAAESRRTRLGKRSRAQVEEDEDRVVASENDEDDDAALNATSTSLDTLSKALSDAWDHDSQLTIKVIYYFRSIVDGAGERLVFYRCAAWLWNNHPRSLIGNLPALVDNVGPAKKMDLDRRNKTTRETSAVEETLDPDNPAGVDADIVDLPGRLHGTWKDLLNILLLVTKELGTDMSMAQLAWADKMEKDPERVELTAAEAKEERHTRLREQVHTVQARLQSDKTYALFYARVVDMFAEQLHEDFKNANVASGLRNENADPTTELWEVAGKVSYAAKWAPNEAKSVDEQLGGLATAIALSLAAKDASGPASHNAVLRAYRTKLVMLRNFKAVPELKMRGPEWQGIRYANVPARCFSINHKHFKKHDTAGFMEHMTKVAAGEASIAGGSLLPPHIVAKAGQAHEALDKDLLNAQWDSMVQTLKEEIEAQKQQSADQATPGTGESRADAPMGMLPLVDVSGSMCTSIDRDITAMDASIALGLLISTLTGDPWRGHMMTFETNPQMVKLTHDVTQPRKFIEHVAQIRRLAWGGSTNIHSAFDLVLRHAQQRRLPPSATRIRICIFSDMHFDVAVAEDDLTTLDGIRDQFASAGYECPQLIFWNLAGRGKAPKPAIASDPDVICLSGFSGAQMKALLDGTIDQLATEEEPSDFVGAGGDGPNQQATNPRKVMDAILGRDSFDGIKVW